MTNRNINRRGTTTFSPACRSRIRRRHTSPVAEETPVAAPVFEEKQERPDYDKIAADLNQALMMSADDKAFGGSGLTLPSFNKLPEIVLMRSKEGTLAEIGASLNAVIACEKELMIVYAMQEIHGPDISLKDRSAMDWEKDLKERLIQGYSALGMDIGKVATPHYLSAIEESAHLFVEDNYPQFAKQGNMAARV